MKKSLDRHLNLFWNYSGNAWKEDNMTRALINTLEFLEEGDKILFVKHILEKFKEKNQEVKKMLKELKNMGDIKVIFDLQNPYIQGINKLDCLKLLMGLNPIGKTWDQDFDHISDKVIFKDIEEEILKNNNKLKKYLLEELSEYIENKDKNIENIIESVKTRKNRGGSRPDGWIFVYIKKELKLIIAVESKLWDLDPYQLDNHLEKCLGVEDKENTKHIFKFNEVCEHLKEKQIEDETIGKIIRNFLEYMELNGYYINTDPFREKDVLDIKGIEKEEWEKIIKPEEKEIKKEIEKRNEVLARKWRKYFEKYFKSEEWEVLAKEENLKKDSTHQWVNFIGPKENIYFDIDCDPTNNFAFFMSLEMGQKTHWRAREIKNNIKIDKISEINDEELKKLEVESKYQVFKRVNSLSYSKYFWIYESDALEDCLTYYKNQKEDKFYKTKLDKEKCLEEIETFKNGSNIDSIKSIIGGSERCSIKGDMETPKSYYNLLSYLRFVDSVRYDDIYGKNEKEIFELFTKMIKKHCNIVKMLNKK